MHIFVVQVLAEVGNDFVAAGEFALDRMFDGKPGFLAVEGQNFVDGVKQFLRLTRSDFDIALGLFGRRDWLGRLLRGWGLGGLL